MLAATEVPTLDERREALRLIPWARELEDLAGVARAALSNQAIDLIDAAMGVDSHMRPSLVAAYEGFDVLLQAAINFVDSHLAETVFARVDPLVPLADGESLAGKPGRDKVPFRFAKYALEQAAVQVASGGDHLANAHIRLAWEANAASEAEVRECGFDPSLPEPETWLSVRQLRDGLRTVRRTYPLSVLDAFALNDEFRQFARSRFVQRTYTFRNEVVHRARPTYRESPAFGRTSAWTTGRIKISYPPPPLDPSVPSLDDRRRMVAGALERALTYATALWATAVRLLDTVEIHIRRVNGGVQVTTNLSAIAGRALYPRAGRDPGPFLSV